MFNLIENVAQSIEARCIGFNIPEKADLQGFWLHFTENGVIIRKHLGAENNSLNSNIEGKVWYVQARGKITCIKTAQSRESHGAPQTQQCWDTSTPRLPHGLSSCSINHQLKILNDFFGMMGFYRFWPSGFRNIIIITQGRKLFLPPYCPYLLTTKRSDKQNQIGD